MLKPETDYVLRGYDKIIVRRLIGRFGPKDMLRIEVARGMYVRRKLLDAKKAARTRNRSPRR